MFYSTQILAKKGPLGIIWIAAHMDSRLKRNNVFETSIPSSVDSILNPEAPLALRLSGQLLLGVVKIYNKKVLYLFQDCNDALSKMQQAFKPGTTVLSGDGKAAPMQVITMPEDYGDFDVFEQDGMNIGAIDSSQLQQFTLSSRDNLLLADDGTAIFSTPLSYHEEQFEVDGEELERHLSMGYTEQLREAAEPEVQRHLFEGHTNLPYSPVYSKGDELLPDVPPDEDIVPAPPSAPDSSQHALDHTWDGLTPGALDAPMQEDLIPAMQLEVEPDSQRREGAVRTVARQRAGEKRKRAIKDVDVSGQPATTISSSAIRTLLTDRQPLLKQRSRADKRALLAQLPGHELHMATNHETATGRLLLIPGMSNTIGPALYAVYQCKMGANGLNARLGHQPGEQAEGDVDAQAMDYAVEALPVEENADAFDTPISDAQHGDGIPDNGADTGLASDGIPAPFTADGANNASPMVRSPGRRPASSRKRSDCDADEPEDAAPQSDFTARTQYVLKQVKSKLNGEREGKKQRLHGAAATGVGFGELHNSGTRTEAARLFFELLVLQARRKVTLSQPEPYATISVTL